MVWVLRQNFGFWSDSPAVWDDSDIWIDGPLAPVAQQVRRGGQWDPSNWYVRSEEEVRVKIREAICSAMGLDEVAAGAVAARMADSAANPHLESILPGHEAEYLSHWVAANASAAHAAREAQEQDDEEAIMLLMGI